MQRFRENKVVLPIPGGAEKESGSEGRSLEGGRETIKRGEVDEERIKNSGKMGM